MILNANALHIPLADNSVQCVVTSPPYYGLRDYGTARWEGGDLECTHNPQRPDGGERADRSLPLGGGGMYRDVCGKCGAIRIDDQIGLEESPEAYVANIVAVFREVKRVLREDGVCFVNLGDSYNGSGGEHKKGGQSGLGIKNRERVGAGIGQKNVTDLKPKDLIGIPWRVAFALQADGWWLRSDIIWNKSNPMPESVKDRPTKSHEYVFLLTKSPRYYFDQDAVREPHAEASLPRALRGLSADNKWADGAPGSTAHTISQPRQNVRKEWEEEHGGRGSGFNGHSGYMDANGRLLINPNGRNIRTVWTIATQPTSYAHFATFPEKLVEPCIKAGTSERGCCPKCGEPWQRVTEHKNAVIKLSQRALDKRAMGLNTALHGTQVSPPSSVTTGWRPGCACDAGDAVPCIVFDPFAGSGTVERVAVRLRRRSIGTELNYQYIREIAARRTADIQPTIF